MQTIEHDRHVFGMSELEVQARVWIEKKWDMKEHVVCDFIYEQSNTDETDHWY